MMARIRTVKPEFFRHRRLYLAEKETKLPLRVAFAGLWGCADREGRFKWEPEELKLDCLPYDDLDFSRVLDALGTRHFIAKYEAAGRWYGCIPAFKLHQVINNRESPSSLPVPPKEIIELASRGARVDDASSTRHDLAQGEGKGRERKGREKGTVGLKPDEAHQAGRNGHDLLTTRSLRAQAVEILSFLNDKAGRAYETVPANIDFIVARLKEGATVEDCRAVIAKKVREWLGDPEMNLYLRPATLFNRTKFAQYKGELVARAA